MRPAEGSSTKDTRGLALLPRPSRKRDDAIGGSNGAAEAGKRAFRYSRRPRLGWALRPLEIDVASRVGILLVVLAISYNERTGIGTLLRAWDGKWFLMAARYGYPSALPVAYGNAAQSTLGFFPAFPVLIRLVHLITTLGYEAAALAVVTVAGAAASLFIWRLVADVDGERAADYGTALIMFSPAAFVLSMVYSEALLMAALAGCLLMLRRGRWLAAGLLGAVASATDPLGIAVVLPCAVAALLAVRHRREWRSLLAPLLAPAGVVAFFCYLWVHDGTPLAYYIAQRHGWQGGALGTGIYVQFTYLVSNGFNEINDTVKAASTLAIAALLVVFLRRRPPIAITLYVIGALVLAALSPIISWTPRVALRAFPLFGFTALKLPVRWIPIAIGLSALLMATLCYLALANAQVPYTP